MYEDSGEEWQPKKQDIALQISDNEDDEAMETDDKEDGGLKRRVPPPRAQTARGRGRGRARGAGRGVGRGVTSERVGQNTVSP